MTDYSIYNDEELCAQALSDPHAEEFLLVKYKELVRSEAKNLYLSWGEWDDLLQEGMIGLLQAIRGYRSEEKAGFAAFARLCIRGKMLNAVTAANRKKHIAMEDYVSLDSPVFQNEDGSALYGVGRYDNPENQVIARESAGVMEQRILEVLSAFEQKVFRESLHGLNYREIAEKLGKTPKSIDNTLQRIRKKTQGLNL